MNAGIPTLLLRVEICGFELDVYLLACLRFCLLAFWLAYFPQLPIASTTSLTVYAKWNGMGWRNEQTGANTNLG